MKISKVLLSYIFEPTVGVSGSARLVALRTSKQFQVMSELFLRLISRVKSDKFGHQVNSDTHLQTVEIQMRRLLVSRLIRIFTVCLVNLIFIPITVL